ncbi:MAG TPA: hypothetical protein PKD29_01785 [Rhodocyclaceae bacterium]|nr:hypothetical protein [Rhodocyclaceae bacterium]
MSEIVRAAIVARLRTVPGVGQVFDYERYAASEGAFRALYAPGGGRVLGWHVRRVARREVTDENVVHTDWEIRGFMALDDAGRSEIAFDTLIDAILDAWRADPTLGGLVFWPKDDGPFVPDLADSGPAMFSGVLCHAVKLKLTTRHALDVARPWS